MKIPRPPHSWQLSPKRAVALQRELAGRVRYEPLPRRPRIVAGVDCAFSREGDRCIAGAVLWDVERREVLEERLAWLPLRFPYVPGLLSFRECPAMLAALRKLRGEPEAILVDGHGVAHPSRLSDGTG